MASIRHLLLSLSPQPFHNNIQKNNERDSSYILYNAERDAQCRRKRVNSLCRRLQVRAAPVKDFYYFISFKPPPGTGAGKYINTCIYLCEDFERSRFCVHNSDDDGKIINIYIYLYMVHIQKQNKKQNPLKASQQNTMSIKLYFSKPEGGDQRRFTENCAPVTSSYFFLDSFAL